MAQTSMDILKRPFSVEPITNVMLPDGIFDLALTRQKLTCYYTNTGAAPLNDVTLYLEGVSDTGIVPEARTYSFPVIPPGASVRVEWVCDFTHASIGKKNVSFIAQAAGQEMRRTLKQIFVSKTSLDTTTGTFTCEVPEGSIRVKFHQVIGPSDKDWNSGGGQGCCGCKCGCGGDHGSRGGLGPWLPTRVTLEVTPSTPYTGQFGDIPFQDPWWKVLGWIVAAIAAIVAIVAAALGHGTAGFGVSGTFDESDPSVSCCRPDPGATADTTGADTVAGVASTIAAAGVAVGLADLEDPWQRGREATPPGPGEITLSETVKVEFTYPPVIQAGTPYVVHVKWNYTRVTNVRSYTLDVEEDVGNSHLVEKKVVTAPPVISHFEPAFRITANFFQKGSKLYTGDALYVFALVLSPGRVGFIVPLNDDGLLVDAHPNDGTYTGQLSLPAAFRLLRSQGSEVAGDWHVFVYAQDLNTATARMPPLEAATHLGGFVVASATELSLDSTLPCPLKADATVRVIV